MNSLYKYWIDTFWKYPDRLTALKVTLAIAVGLIPSLYLGYTSFGVLFSLGVVGNALSETQVHPKARLKTSFVSILLFAFTAITVELVYPYTVLFGVLLGVTTFGLLLIGGINRHYQKVTFGILLFTVYTMLGVSPTNPWYFQALCFVCGAAFYSLISVTLLYFKPWRVINELMSVGYRKLAQYAIVKSTLFPSKKEEQEKIQMQLAQINIDLSRQIDIIKFELDCIYKHASPHTIPKVYEYYRKWELLQELHMRFASSHERYDLLSRSSSSPEVIAGFGQLTRELGKAAHRYADVLLTGRPYEHPISLQWTSRALPQLLEKNKGLKNYAALTLLLKNLLQIEERMVHFDEPDVSELSESTPQYPRSVPLREMFDSNNARFRFSVRLTIVYVVGFTLIDLMEISKGGWVLMHCLIIAQQTYSDTRQRLLLRVYGTVVGIVLGVVLNTILPTDLGQIILLLGSIYLFFAYIWKNYAIAVVFVTTFVLAVYNILTHQGVDVMVPRLIDTLLAAFLVFAATRLLWPDWQYKRLPGLLKTSLEENLRYMLCLSEGSKDAKTRDLLKRRAHQADNELSMAWRNMLSEPKRKRWYLDNAYNLSYLNHSLLSYISAFESQKFYNDITSEESLYFTEISEILRETLLVIEQTSELDNSARIKQFQEWEAKLFGLKKQTQLPKIILIHNITRVSVEMFIETDNLVHQTW